MAPQSPPQLPDEAAGSDETAAMKRALQEVPRGAVALAGAAVVLLMICWFAIYVFVFLPRGSVG